MGIVRPSRPSDVADFVPRLREADRQEVYSTTGLSPYLILSYAASSGETLSMVGDHGEVIGMFGCGPVHHMDCFGAIWLLISKTLEENRKYVFQFLRETPWWINHFHETYPVLYNYVDARNELHLRWVKWMGFQEIRRIDRWGYEGRPYVKIIKVKE